MGGAPVTTSNFSGETSAIVYHQALGYDITSPPYLLHYKATSPVADSYVTPTSTDVRADASYMGWNASLAQLEIYADTAAKVEVYDGRDHTLRGTFNVAAGTIFTTTLDAIGFTADQPFVAAVASDVPVYQEIRIPDFLRQYPGDVGPKIN
jgi:hypothetical protein